MDSLKFVRYTVRIRRGLGEVKPEAEQIDGKTYLFTYGWPIEENTLYKGEHAWIPRDPNYPLDASRWISSGDLEVKSIKEKSMSTSDRKKTVEDGSLAYIDGKKLVDNPYRDGYPIYNAWGMGWRRAWNADGRPMHRLSCY